MPVGTSNWADDLPPKEVKYERDKGLKYVTEYKYDETGERMKITQVYRVEIKKVSKAVIARKKWQKFGTCKNDGPGIDQATTYIGDEVFINFIHDKGLDEQENAQDDPLAKLKTKADQNIMCRHCRGAHWTHRCPYIDKLDSLKALQEGPDSAGSAPGGAPGSGANGAGAGSARPGVYVPPHKQPGGPGAGGPGGLSMQRRDDQYTIRVSNLPEDAKEQDLYELFDHFGKIHRVFLAKDKVSRQSKGFAFITYVTKDSAQRSIIGINGYAYDHLILKVEWAKPSNQP